MNNILLVGNGFDLAHGLRTKYEHFLEVMKNRDSFNMAVDYYMKNGKPLETSNFYDYFKDIKTLNADNISKFQEILKTNSWVKYYSECGAEIDGWIDFEREIIPVIDMFELILNSDYLIRQMEGISDALIDKKFFSTKLLRIASLWGEYVNTQGGSNVIVNSKYVTSQYGILKKKIMNSLRESFDEFIRAFEIYLHEFVYRKENMQPLKQIEEINADYVISFNYTLTERLYGVSEEDTHHIHGMIREDLTSGKNNMVVGVNEQDNQNMDFIYFVKYFQRIQKASGTKYKDFINIEYQAEEFDVVSEEYTLHVYGHSLDETDEDILRYVIGDKNGAGKIKLKPEQVIIYYYDAADYEQKVINLIKLYNRSIVEEYMEQELFKFVPTSKELCEA